MHGVFYTESGRGSQYDDMNSRQTRRIGSIVVVLMVICLVTSAATAGVAAGGPAVDDGDHSRVTAVDSVGSSPDGGWHFGAGVSVRAANESVENESEDESTPAPTPPSAPDNETADDVDERPNGTEEGTSTDEAGSVVPLGAERYVEEVDTRLAVDHESGVVDVAVFPNGDLVVLGEFRDFQETYVARVTQDGDVVWSTSIALDNSNLGAIATTDSGEVVVAGEAYSDGAHLFVLSGVGEVASRAASYEDVVYDGIAVEDRTILVAGTVDDHPVVDKFNLGPLGVPPIFEARNSFDRTGSLYDVIATADGPISVGYVDEEAYAVGFTDDLNVRWSESYGAADPNGEFYYRAVTTPDGDVVAIGEADESERGRSDDVRLARFDGENGDAVWTETFGTDDTDVGYDVFRVGDRIVSLVYPQYDETEDNEPAKAYRVDPGDGSRQILTEGANRGDTFVAGVGVSEDQLVIGGYESPPPDSGDEFGYLRSLLIRGRLVTTTPVTEVSNLDAPAAATAGDSVTVSATIRNTGDVRLDGGEADFRLDLDGDGDLSASETLASERVDLPAGAATTVTFRADTTGTVPGTYTHGVVTADDIATGVIEVEPRGATGTAVRLDPSTEALESGETATFDVVMDDASSGVGGFNVEVSSGDTDVATITDVEFASNVDTSEAEFAADNSSVQAEQALSNIESGSNVTLATVTVTGEGAGTTDLSLSVTEVVDAAGSIYDTRSVSDATVSVESAPTASTSVRLDPSTESLEAGETATFDVVAGETTEDVGSYSLEVATSDASVLAVEAVSLNGDPSLRSTNVANDGSSATVSAASTATTDLSTLATVTATATAEGSATLSLSDVQVGYGDGSGDYDVDSLEAASVDVTDGGGSAGRTATVVLDGASNGLGAYNLTVATPGSGAAITSVKGRSDATLSQTAAGGVGESSVTYRALFQSFEPTSDEVTLLTVEFSEPVPRDALSLVVSDLSDADSNDIERSRVSLRLGSGNPFPDGVPGVSGETPTDPDSDGRYEDVNGDGERTLADAFAFAFGPLQQADGLSDAQVRALDFDGDGSLDLDDAFALAFGG
jgi:hypothetical protein